MRPKILGWDATGIVTAVGEAVTLFQPATTSFMLAHWSVPAATVLITWLMNALSVTPRDINNRCPCGHATTSLTAYEALFEQLHIPLTQLNLIPKNAVDHSHHQWRWWCRLSATRCKIRAHS